MSRLSLRISCCWGLSQIAGFINNLEVTVYGVIRNTTPSPKGPSKVVVP